jgi:hypothetical protein
MSYYQPQGHFGHFSTQDRQSNENNQDPRCRANLSMISRQLGLLVDSQSSCSHPACTGTMHIYMYIYYIAVPAYHDLVYIKFSYASHNSRKSAS